MAVMDPTLPMTTDLPNGPGLKEDLQIVHAAKALQLEETYYDHIMWPHLHRFGKLTGEDLTEELYDQIAMVDTWAADSDDALLRQIAKTLARLYKAGETPEGVLGRFLMQDMQFLKLQRSRVVRGWRASEGVTRRKHLIEWLL